jgi:uncharacterized coiled-coil DUF342 family protein
MEDRELYQQKIQAQLDEWRAEIDKLRARVSGKSADAQLEWNQRIRQLEEKVEEGKAKLDELGETSDEAWKSVQKGFASAWTSLRSAFSDAVAKFRD